jgi:hypothetical protein
MPRNDAPKMAYNGPRRSTNADPIVRSPEENSTISGVVLDPVFLRVRISVEISRQLLVGTMCPRRKLWRDLQFEADRRDGQLELLSTVSTQNSAPNPEIFDRRSPK